MAGAPIVALSLVSLVSLLPAAALAHGGGDAPLHVDPSVEECSVRFAPGLTQGAYRRFVREFGSVSAFKQASPPTTLGRWGFAVDVEQLFFTVEDHAAAWNDTFVHPDAEHWLGADKAIPKLRLRLGVSDDVEVGAFYTKSPGANYGWLGVEAKVGLLEQRGDVPVALSVRAAYTKTLYVADMDMHAVGADVSLGRTFWRILTPYVGVGADAVLARETSDAVNLRTERVVVPHATVGVEARTWHVAIGAEAQLATVSSYQVQVSAVF